MVSNSQHLVLAYLTSNLHRIVVLHLSDGVIAPSSWSRIPSSARAKLDGRTFIAIGIASGPFSPESITSPPQGECSKLPTLENTPHWK